MYHEQQQFTFEGMVHGGNCVPPCILLIKAQVQSLGDAKLGALSTYEQSCRRMRSSVHHSEKHKWRCTISFVHHT